MARLSAPAIGIHITTLASPGFEGRGLGQRGLEATAEYLASTLAGRGVAALTPDQSGASPTAAFFHPVPTREISGATGQVTVETRIGATAVARSFLSGVDCLFQERPPSVIAGPVVFAGYGIREATPSRDDYRNLDVKDRIVVVLSGVPPGAEWHTAALMTTYASDEGRTRYEAKAALAMSLGARALVAIEDQSFPSADGIRQGRTGGALLHAVRRRCRQRWDDSCRSGVCRRG